jgi:hypothetical protein
MAANTYVKDVLYRVSVQLHDLSPQFTRWTQRELVSWLNDGQRAIAKYVPSSCSRVDAVKLVPGTKQSISSIPANRVIPGDGSTPVAISGTALMSAIRNMGTDGATVGRAIRLVDRDVLDLNSPDWHTEVDTKVSSYTFDPRTPDIFFVSPGVHATTAVWAELSYIADPVDVSQSGTYTWDGNSTAKISIDDTYVDDLTNYILSRAYGKDSENAANLGLAAAYDTAFSESIRSHATALAGINPNIQGLAGNPLAVTPR